LRSLLLAFLFVGVAAGQSIPRQKSIPAIARDANGAVVSILMSDQNGHPVAQGSGFLISSEGRIVTNYHVVQHGSSAVVKLPGGGFFAVEGILSFDKGRDIAVIKVQGENFRTVPLGDSDRIQVGAEVVAIGNPLSLESTVSNGIVSGIRTLKEDGGKYLQITAPISPGSSGGPLFNMAGEVIGITTSYLRGGENLNFAIPINDVKRMLMAGYSKVRDFPNEAEDSVAGANGENVEPICGFIMRRMSTVLPQLPTLCEKAPVKGAYPSVSVFSPTPALAGSLRRGWSTALFQTLQVAAQGGPCESGCTVAVSDSQMASRRLHYETDISKVSADMNASVLSQMGGFASDSGYLLGWSNLLQGITDETSGSKETTESLAKSACENYVRSLRQDAILTDMLKNDSKHYSGLPTCSVMVATASSAYVLVDFGDIFLPALTDLSEPLPKAFGHLDRFKGGIIFRGPWHSYDNGITARYYEQYSLHWLGFVRDEIASEDHTDAMARLRLLLLLNGDWVRQAGQIYPNTIFAKDAKPGTIVTRDAAVYKIVQFGAYSHVQLTDGTEWTLSPESLNACSLKEGDEVSLFAVKSADGEKGVSPAKGNCSLKASFVGSW
jgi:S1-C subfamily serine protease